MNGETLKTFYEEMTDEELADLLMKVDKVENGDLPHSQWETYYNRFQPVVVDEKGKQLRLSSPKYYQFLICLLELT